MLGYFLDEKRPGEIYNIGITSTGFSFKIKEALYQFIKESIKRKEVLSQFLEIPKNNVGEFAVIDVSLPFIRFPNYAHRRTDWARLSECAEQVQFLLSLFNMSYKDSENSELYLSDGLQLMAVRTGYRKDTHFHACNINVGFCLTARRLLAEKYPQGANIEKCEDTAFDFFHGLSVSTRRQIEKSKKLYSSRGSSWSSINVSVRNGGTPHFIVPGNCACLGANPDEFAYQGDLYSHNLDTTLQQMTMLASLASFRELVLKPLYIENK